MANDTKIKKWLKKKRKKEMVFKQRSNHGHCQKKKQLKQPRVWL